MLQAQSVLQNIKFTRFTAGQGLSQNTVHGIIQDKKGVLWFATADGLNRYDGYGFKIYRSEIGNPNSLSNNYIVRIYEDRAGHIWLGTLGGGLNRFDPDTETFVRYQHDKNDSTTISSNTIRGIYEDNQGIIWIGTYGGGLNCLDPKTQKITRFPYVKKTGKPNPEGIWHVIGSNHQGLWLATTTGLYYFDKLQGKYTRHAYTLKSKQTGFKNRIFHLVPDRHNSDILWLCTIHCGLIKFNTKDWCIEERFEHDPANESSISHNSAFCFYQDDNGNSWVGNRKGFHLFDPATKKFTHLFHNPKDKNTISGNNVQVIFPDNAGTIWLGTYDGGISSFTPHLDNFMHYANIEPEVNSRTGSFAEDLQGNIWIGMGRGKIGLAKLNRKNKTIDTFQPERDNPGSIGGSTVNTLMADVDGSLWVGFLRKGLDQYDPKTGVFTHYPPKRPKGLIIQPNHVGALYQNGSKPDIIWIGGRGEGLLRFDKRTRQFKVYLYNKGYTVLNPGQNTIINIVQDHKGNLWLATRGGLRHFNPKTEVFTNYLHSEDNLQSLSHNYVTSLYIDKHQTLWIGTRYGLNKLNLNDFYQGKPKFKWYTTKDGLSNNVIHKVVEDRQGFLWLSTNKGLIRFDPTTTECTHYSESNGLQGNEFATGSGLVTRDGAILMGGANGFNLFYPRNINKNTYNANVLITDFQVFNKSVPVTKKGKLRRPVWATDTIELSYKDKVISFEFAALSYIAPEKNTYKIKLENFDNDWRFLGTKHSETYTNLPAGTYIFRVKAANNDGVWSSTETCLTVIVYPPFWRTNTFYALMVILLILLVAGMIRWRTRTLKKQKKILEYKVDKRTEEIKMQAEELKTQTEEITSQAEELKKINEQLVELDDFKQGVTGMIVHDLKNPLNTLLAYAKSPEIKQSASQMHHMVLNILDVQKLESTELQLHWDVVDLPAMIDEAIAQVKVLSLQKNLYITKYCEIKYQVRTDKDITVRIMVNLLTNAIKHAPLNSGIEIRAVQETDTEAKVMIIDEGDGVPLAIQDKIFDKFFSIEAKKANLDIKSTGLGLAFCKLAIEAQEGTIGVTNYPGKGAQFWFTLQLIDVEVQEVGLVAETHQNNLMLSDDDKHWLGPFARLLAKIEVYEMGTVKKMVDSIDDQNRPNVQQWKALVTEATFSMNQVLYNELMGLVE